MQVEGPAMQIYMYAARTEFADCNVTIIIKHLGFLSAESEDGVSGDSEDGERFSHPGASRLRIPVGTCQRNSVCDSQNLRSHTCRYRGNIFESHKVKLITCSLLYVSFFYLQNCTVFHNMQKRLSGTQSIQSCCIILFSQFHYYYYYYYEHCKFGETAENGSFTEF